MKKLFLKPGKERLADNKHPWIFSGALMHKPTNFTIGDVVQLCDQRGQPIGIGHFCAAEGLSVRMLSFDPNVVIDDNFYLARFRRAAALRRAVGLPNAHTTGYRLIHGEGDGLSGLVCDIFGNYAVIGLTNPGLAQACLLLGEFLQRELGVKKVCLPDARGDVQVPFLENGLKFDANCADGQKTGHFLDQRDNRLKLSEMAAGRTVLDAFSYSGGFSLYALKGGAQSVTSLDISADALQLVSQHAAVNGPFAGQHQTWCEDAFAALRTIEKDHFDLIVLDPPAFAKSASAVERAARGYKDINWLALKNIKAGGLLFTFSCSQHIDVDLFKKIIFAAAKDAERDVAIVQELSQGADHPVSVYCPQSAYLKGLVLYVA